MRLVKHHLTENEKQPFTMHKDGHTLIPDSTCLGKTKKFNYLDKIAIFSSFPLFNGAILYINQFLYLIASAHYDTICRFINCTISRLLNYIKITMKKQQSVAEAFCKSISKEGYQILLLFNIGIINPNLTFANIIIMIVSNYFVQQSLLTDYSTTHYLICPQ